MFLLIQHYMHVCVSDGAANQQKSEFLSDKAAPSCINVFDTDKDTVLLSWNHIACKKEKLLAHISTWAKYYILGSTEISITRQKVERTILLDSS